VHDARGRGGTHCVGALHLAHGDGRHAFTGPAAALQSDGDAALDICKMVRDMSHALVWAVGYTNAVLW
jgi:hypothetical protein